MKHKIKTVVLDCDGIIWQDGGFTKKAILIARYLGISEQNEQEFAKKLKSEMYHLILKLFNSKITYNLIYKNLDYMLKGEEFKEYGIKPGELMYAMSMPSLNPCVETMGAEKTIKYLKRRGYKLIAKSNWLQSVQMARLARFGLLKYFDMVEGPIEDYFKPNPKAAEKIIGKEDPKSFVMVGDTLKTDILFAHYSGMKSILVNEELCSKEVMPNFQVTNFVDIMKIL